MKAVGAMDSPTGAAISATGTLTVLLAEPDSSTAGNVSSWLQERGHAVVGVVARGEDLLAVATASRPGVVVIDASLPCPESPLRTALRVRDQLGIPVILTTADARGIFPLHGEAGLSQLEVLEKPFGPDTLAAAIRSVAARRRAWERVFRRVVDAMPCFVMILDAALSIRDVSLPGTFFAGLSRGTLAGRKAVGTILPPSGRDVTDLRECFDEERGFSVATDCIPIAGCRIPIRWTCEPARDPGGCCAGWVCLGTLERDVSCLDLCLQEGALRQLEENIVQLATLNDRIRNPLQVIAASAGLLDGDVRDRILLQVEAINEVVRELDRGSVESVAVREYLRKHRQIPAP